MAITSNTDRLYDTDLTDAAWELIAPMLPVARPGGRPRTTNIRAVLSAIFYLLRGCLKSHDLVNRLSMRRIAIRSISVSEVCTRCS